MGFPDIPRPRLTKSGGWGGGTFVPPRGGAWSGGGDMSRLRARRGIMPTMMTMLVRSLYITSIKSIIFNLEKSFFEGLT